MKDIGIVRLGERPPAAIAAWSRGALDRPLAGDAELMVARPSEGATVLGVFQRAPATPGVEVPFVRRGSGGASARVGPGSVWIALSLAHPAALVACEPSRILNRYVRPLLAALTKVGATAHYFGRDWISVQHRPAALLAFAHDAASRRTVFEAIVAVSHPFATGPRPSFLGKEPGTLAEIVGHDFDLDKVETAVIDAYATAYARHPIDLALAPALDLDLALDLALDLDLDLDLALALDSEPWLATADEAIGPLGAGPDARGIFRVGGDLMVSRDALATLERRALHTPPDSPHALAALVNETLGAPGVALEGVRNLASIAEVIAAARARGPVAPP